jgi:hypothetical protein
MSGQPAAVTRSTLIATTASRVSLAACLLLVGSHLGLAGWEHQEVDKSGRVFRARSCQSCVQPGNHAPWAAAYALDRESGDFTLGCSQNTSTSHESSTCCPILSHRPAWPPTEGLREDYPTQVRVGEGRWRTARLTTGSRVLLAGRLPNRRSLRGASQRRYPSPSLHELFCTWVI